MTIKLSSELVDWLERGGNFPEQLLVDTGEGHQSVYTILDRDKNGVVIDVGNRKGYKGFVLKVADPRTGRPFAAKLALLEDYSGPNRLQDELYNAEMLQQKTSIVTPSAVGYVEPFEGQPDNSAKWLCFISSWVPGQSLKQALEAGDFPMRPSLIVNVLRELVLTVLYIHEKGLKHDDLHLGNIMLEEPDVALKEIDPDNANHQLKIVDLGSLKPINQPTEKPHDDWSNVVSCITQIHNHINTSQPAGSHYGWFLRNLYQLAEKLADPEPTRHFAEKSSYLRQVDLLVQEPSTANHELASPFEAMSAEHLASDSVLRKLFEDNLPWIKTVESKNPIVLTGPRGCGKSMVFRYMAMKTHSETVETANLAIKKFDTWGVYISCSNSLENDLLWLSRTQGKAKKLSDQLVTFLNLILVRELCNSFGAFAALDDFRDVLGVSSGSAKRIVNFVLDALDQSDISALLSQENCYLALASYIERTRLALSRSMRSGNQAPCLLPESFIRDLVSKIYSELPFFKTKPIVFLLDDYTKHRVGEEAQEVLNSVLWQRNAQFYFKVSCEPHGFQAKHQHPARLDKNRDFKDIDTSTCLVDGSSTEARQRREFVTGILDKRLEKAGYAGRTDTLIGKSSYKSDPELAKIIRDHKTGASFFYNGISALSSCWSGDVVSILFIVEKMFIAANVEKSSTQKIPEKAQHEAIKTFSSALVERINHYHPMGEPMRRFLDYWGEHAYHALREAPEHQAKDGKPYVYRLYRVEVPFDGGGDIYKHLDQIDETRTSSELLRQLVRRSVLIELGETKAKEKESRAARFQIRASLLPHYRTSFVRKDHIILSGVYEFHQFLNANAELRRRLEKRVHDPKPASEAKPEQSELFK